MFRIVSIIGFIITFAGIAFHQRTCRPRSQHRCRPIDVLKKLVYLLTLLFLEQKLSAVGIVRKLVYLLALLCFVVLAVTGFYPTLVLGRHLSGYLLMLHATFAPVFAACLAALAVMWAHNCRFDNFRPWLRKLLRREAADKPAPIPDGRPLTPGQKTCFWLIVILALPVILSPVCSMFPLFGTVGQEFLLNLHRYSTLLLTLVAIVHTYLIILSQIKE